MNEAIIGRDAELAELDEAVARVRRRGRALVVHGQPGIGKSVLLAAAARSARSAGATVVSTTGVESETDLPFAGLHDLLRPLLDRVDVLAAPQRRALLSAFGLDDQSAPEHFLIALAALNLLTEAAATAPVVLVADDVQWLDPPTHDVLAFLARRLAGDPVLLVAAVRAGHDSPLLVGGAHVMEVRNLDDAASRRLLAVHAPDLQVADHERILREALGNPLALVELPAAARGAAALTEWVATPLPLSAKLERAFAARLDELPAATRDVLLVAAVDDDELVPEILAGAAALGSPGAAPLGIEALDPAAAADLARIDGTRMRFRHPLVRSAVLQSESVHRRQRAHAALAVVLDADPYRRTWHRAQSIVGPDDRVADELEYIHGVSIRRGAVGPAIAALERAAQLTTTSSDRGRRLLLAAEHAFGLGRADMVDRLVTAAGRNVLSGTERARMQWLREIITNGVSGDPVRVRELVRTAVDCAESDDVGLALNLLLGAALRCWWADTGAEARALVAATVARLPVPATDARRVAALAVAEPVLASAEVSALLAGVDDEQVRDAEALRLYGMAAHAIADPVRSLAFLDRAEARLREQGRLGLLSHVLTMGIGDRLELGDWDGARQAAEEGRRIARDTGQPMWDTGTLSLTSMVLGLRGDNDTAQRLAADAEQQLAGLRVNNLFACIQLGRGFGFVATGRYAEAYSALRRLFDPADPCYHATERFHGVMYLAEAAVHSRQGEDAHAIFSRLEREAAAGASTTLRAHLHYARAVLGAEADPAAAEQLFTTALAADLVRWPLVRARLQLAWGAWLRRARRVAESRLPLRSAMTTLDAVGARTWAEQARAELRAAGEVDALAQAPAVTDILSPQEAQIARLVAEGLSNREVGEQLYLSPRTIGSHLYRIFPKLGITSRNQLAARLRGTSVHAEGEPLTR